MNILLIAKSEYAKKYLYYNGLLAGLELTSGHDIYFTNKTVINVDELEEATGLKFDYVIYGLGWFGSSNYFGEVKCTNAKKIVHLFKPQNDLDRKLSFWKSSDKFETARIHDNEEYAKTINRSKIWIATNASHGDVTPRYYEILGSGTLLFCEEIHESYKSVLKDGYNCVSFKTDLSDFKEKLRFYINNDTERNRIVNNALADSVQKFTWFARASKLLEDIGENK